MKAEAYVQAAEQVAPKLRELLLRVPKERQERITEIRLRRGQPVMLMENLHGNFLQSTGALTIRPDGQSVCAEKSLLEETFLTMCGWSVHSRQRELDKGYLSLAGGHRAGIGGTSIVQQGQVTGHREVHSINLRIAREVFGAADKLVQSCFFPGSSGGVLICGAPASGKTTILRDLIRQMAGAPGGYRKVSVVDETEELSGGGRNDLGLSSDLLCGYPKAQGIETALRYLSPEVLVCDEIASEEEVLAVENGANSGVRMVTSLHAADYEELCRKQLYQRLAQAQVFRYMVFLQGSAAPGRIGAIYNLQQGQEPIVW